MSAHIRHIAGTDDPLVYHRCGRRMQHLNCYIIGRHLASDWWCAHCHESAMMMGDDVNPRQPDKTHSEEPHETY